MITKKQVQQVALQTVGKVEGLTLDEYRQVMLALVDEFGSQAQAAKASGVTVAYYHDVLHGKQGPGPKLLKGLHSGRATMYSLSDGEQG